MPRLLRSLLLPLCAGLAVLSSAQTPVVAPASPPALGLESATVLVIRHAEKPPQGTDLAPEGVARADGYPAFFRSLRLNGKPVHIDAIFATADSKGSHRERLTVEPLAKALKLPINLEYKNKAVSEMAEALRAKPHGHTILICWHHGRIPELLAGLGADPARLLPGGKWPADDFKTLIALRYDASGRLAQSEVIGRPKVVR